MAKEIKFNIRLNVDGREQLATATTSMQEVSDAVNTCRRNARQLNDAFIDLNQQIELVGHFSDFASQLSSAMGGYGQSVAQTAQLTGLSGDALRELRNEAQAFATTFGTDFGETMQAVNALSKGFGITAREALRLVQDGMVSGANATGQFLDTLREYPRYFSEAGLSAEAFVAITTNAARQGVFSDKGVDAIKEANIRLRELTPATQAALEGIGMSAEAVQQALRDGSATTFGIMQQVAERLSTLPASSAEVGAAIADIFGGPGEDAGLEYIKTLATVETSMDAVKAGADDYSKSLDRQAGFLAAVANKLTSVIDLTQVFNTLAPLLNVASQVGMSVVSITAMAKSLQALAATQVAVRVRAVAMGAATCAASAAMAAASAVSRALQAALVGVGVAANTAKVAVRGLMVATGVGIAVAALTVIMEKLIGAFDRAGDAAGEFNEKTAQAAAAKEQEAAAINSARAALEANIARLKGFSGSKEEELRLVREMNSTYGDSMGYYKSVAQWYTALTGNSRAYCRQLVNEYKIRRLASDIAAKEAEMRGITHDESGRVRTYDTERDTKKYLTTGYDAAGNVTLKVAEREVAGSSELDKAQKAYGDLYKSIAASRKEMEALVKDSGKIKMQAFQGQSKTDPFAGAGKGTTVTASAPKPAAPEEGSIAWYERRISDARQRMESTPDVDEARTAIEDMQDARFGLHELKVRIGLEDPVQPVAIAKSVNEQLQAELEPIEISIDTRGVDKSRGALDGATESLRALGGALSSMGRNIELPALDVAGTIAAAIATTIMGFAEASSKEGKLGVWGWIAASVAGLANLMSIVGSIKAMGAFADGGVVSGPTLALVGEYAGAGSNPEVIAPLDRLRTMLNPPVGAQLGAVRFEIEGRRLVGVLANETRTASKSGRRSGIVV